MWTDHILFSLSSVGGHLGCFHLSAAVVTRLRFGCSPLRKPIVKRQVLVGAESLLYSSGRRPGEKVDSCPRTSSEDSTQPGRFFKGKGKRSQWIVEARVVAAPAACSLAHSSWSLLRCCLVHSLPARLLHRGLQTVMRNSAGPVLLRPALRIVLARDSVLLRRERLASRLRSGHHAA